MLRYAGVETSVQDLLEEMGMETLWFSYHWDPVNESVLIYHIDKKTSQPAKTGRSVVPEFSL